MRGGLWSRTVGARGCGSRETILPVALGKHGDYCPLSTPSSAPHPLHPLRDTCLTTPLTTQGPPEAAPLLCRESLQSTLLGDLRSRGRRDTRGLPWEGVAIGGDPQGRGCQSPGLYSTGGHWETPRTELETFSHAVAQRVIEWLRTVMTSGPSWHSFVRLRDARAAGERAARSS